MWGQQVFLILRICANTQSCVYVHKYLRVIGTIMIIPMYFAVAPVPCTSSKSARNTSITREKIYKVMIRFNGFDLSGDKIHLLCLPPSPSPLIGRPNADVNSTRQPSYFARQWSGPPPPPGRPDPIVQTRFAPTSRLSDKGPKWSLPKFVPAWRMYGRYFPILA